MTDSTPSINPTPAEPPAPVPYDAALRFWLKLGFLSFGGPAGQIALMHRELVEQRRWISERRFLHALNYCMLLPGPEAQQLATYIGWLLHRTRGGVAAGVLFVLPSLFILVALSAVYMLWGQVPWVAALFEGLKPAVAALVLQAVHRVGVKTLSPRTGQPRPWLLWALALFSFVGLVVAGLPFPLIVAVAALVGWLGARRWPGQFTAAGGHGSGAERTHPPALIDDHTPTPSHARFTTGRLARVLVVDAPESLQHDRLMRRDGVDEALAARMIAAQASRTVRLAIADDVILNDGDPAHLDTAVAALHARYLAAAQPEALD